MSVLPDSRLFSELSIPATHDTLSDCVKASCFPSVEASQAQFLSLQDQLNYGIRGLDIRVDHADSSITSGEPSGYGHFFGIVHNNIPMGYEFRDDVLKVVADFLQNHPNEAILMSIQEQDAFTPVVGREFIATFEQYMSDTHPGTGRTYGDFFWQSPGGQDDIPTLGEARGKIVLQQDGWADRDTPRVQRWGLDYTQNKSGDPNDPGNTRYYNPLFQKVDSSPNRHPDDRWASSQEFFVETAIGRYLTPAGQPKFYENSLASSINNGIPGTLHHWDSPIEYATGKGCNLVSCRYIDGMNQRALSYLQSGQPRSAGIVYMDFPELGNTVDWSPDETVVLDDTLINTIVEVNFPSHHYTGYIGEISLYDNPNAPQNDDLANIECQLFVRPFTQDIDFRGDEGYTCDNDEAQSMTLRGVVAGTKLLIHDSPTFDDSADNTHVTVLRDIPGKYIIGTFEQTYADDYIRMEYFGDGTLDGKVSAIRIADGGDPTTSHLARPFVVDYLEARRELNSFYEASDLFDRDVPPDAASISRYHTQRYDTVNFSGDGGRFAGGAFGQNETFPDGDVRDRSNYFLRATAQVQVPVGQWSIAFGSDDGGQLTLEDALFQSRFNLDDPLQRSGSNQVLYNAQRGYAWTGGHFTVSNSALATELVASMFERLGGDAFEIAIRNNADFAHSNQVSPANGWVLLRDGALGWSLGAQLPAWELLEEGGSFATTATNHARGGAAFARDVISAGGLPSHQVNHLNDGVYGNGNSWIGDSENSFAGISLGRTPIQFNQLAFGRSNVLSGDPCLGGVCTDRSLGTYTIQFTTVPNPDSLTHDSLWTTFGVLNYEPGNPSQPHVRHLYQFPAVLATGIRILAPTGAAIDEIELYSRSGVSLPETYRINAGGSQLAGDPVWSEDTLAVVSPYHDPFTSVFFSNEAIDLAHPSIPAGTPMEMFQTERYPAGGRDLMTWAFPVAPGDYEVRLYFAELYYDTVGAAVFDVAIEGGAVLDNYDILTRVPKFSGVMERFLVASDQFLNIEFTRVIGDPVINGIEILPAVALPPANDDFADALAIVPNLLFETDTSQATAELFEPEHAGVATATKSVWYEWTAPANGNAVISTQGSDFDTVLAVYSGTVLFGLTPIASNDDRQAGVDATSEVVLAAVAGVTYRIALAGYGERAGNADLRMTFQPTMDRVAGDSNGDGIFDSGDLVVVFVAGEYEDAIPNNSTFEEGDWDGDGDFTTADLVFAFIGGTYQANALPRSAHPVNFLDTAEDHFQHRSRRSTALIDVAFAGDWDKELELTIARGHVVANRERVWRRRN